MPLPLARLLLALLALVLPSLAAAKPPVVLAAASLQEAMTAAADAWAARGHERPVISFAASSALARQIEAGAPADIFVSADQEWMDAIAAKNLIKRATRATFLGNRLVLIAPADSRLRIGIRPSFPLARALGNGRLSVADPDAVPAGRYAKAALTSLHVWPSVSDRLARAENVRAALALVERGEAPLGIVYATDARASAKVRAVGVFPAGSHPPVTYPLAVLAASTSVEAEPFRRFLLSRPGRAIFARYGFSAK